MFLLSLSFKYILQCKVYIMEKSPEFERYVNLIKSVARGKPISMDDLIEAAKSCDRLWDSFETTEQVQKWRELGVAVVFENRILNGEAPEKVYRDTRNRGRAQSILKIFDAFYI